MRSYSRIRVPLLSFYSRSLYRDVGVNWRGAAYAYLLLALAICWLPVLVGVYGNWSRFMGTQAEPLLEQIPAVSITNGMVSADVAQPHYIRSHDTGKVLAILDTTGQIQSLEGADAPMLVTRTHFIMKKGERETRMYDLSAIQSFAIDRDRVRKWLQLCSVWGPQAVYLVAVVFSYAYRLLQGLVFGLVALALRRPLGSALGYPGVVSLALIAATPAVIVKTGLDVMGIAFPFRELVILALAFGYLCFGLRATRVPPPIGDSGEVGTTPT